MKEPGKQLSYSEFLEFIAKDETYEFVDGYPVAMGGASTIHQRIVGEFVFMLKGHLREQNCDVYPDVRVWVGYRDRVPGVAVTCDQYDVSEAPDVLHSPKLIIEVLSAKRSGELDQKLKDYQARPSVEEYVVVDSRKRWLRRYSRSGGRQDFIEDPVRISGSIILTSVNYMLDLDELYRLVRYRGA